MNKDNGYFILVTSYTIATSSCESETMGMHVLAKFFVHMEAVAKALDFPQPLPMPMHGDNTAALALVSNRVSGPRSRHINLQYFSTRQMIQDGLLAVFHCPTEEMLADIFTKPLARAKFEYFRNILMGASAVDSRMSA
jgi:KUP system potassium uptake protein